MKLKKGDRVVWHCGWRACVGLVVDLNARLGGRSMIQVRDMERINWLVDQNQLFQENLGERQKKEQDYGS